MDWACLVSLLLLTEEITCYGKHCCNVCGFGLYLIGLGVLCSRSCLYQNARCCTTSFKYSARLGLGLTISVI
jgi:hypothetical protein